MKTPAGACLRPESRRAAARGGLQVKRAMDIGLAMALLVLLAPLLLVIAVAIRLSSPGPALLVQQRLGQSCQPFGMYKFRTMIDGAARLERAFARRQSNGTFFKPDRDQRVTRLGAVLRKASLDELPQLLNVLRGEMSLVGPRPLLLTEFERFPVEREKLRFSVRPGMTGLWQVSGRNTCSDRMRMYLDRKYVREWSLTADLLILARTVPAVLSGRGAV